MFRGPVEKAQVSSIKASYQDLMQTTGRLDPAITAILAGRSAAEDVTAFLRIFLHRSSLMAAIGGDFLNV